MFIHRRLAWSVLAIVLVMVTSACAPPEAGEDLADVDSMDEHPHHEHGHGMPAAEPAEYSIYHASSVWTDQHGERRPLDSLAGRVQVVGMVYTSCGHACPRMLLDMKRIEDETGRSGGVGFVLVTIDPERDTPERLAEYAAGARLDPERWTLLHGAEGDILELAALLGVRYRQMANGEFIHSNLLTVLDPAGQLAHRQKGLGSDPAETLAVIQTVTGAD